MHGLSVRVPESRPTQGTGRGAIQRRLRAGRAGRNRTADRSRPPLGPAGTMSMGVTVAWKQIKKLSKGHSLEHTHKGLRASFLIPYSPSRLSFPRQFCQSMGEDVRYLEADLGTRSTRPRSVVENASAEVLDLAFWYQARGAAPMGRRRNRYSVPPVVDAGVQCPRAGGLSRGANQALSVAVGDYTTAMFVFNLACGAMWRLVINIYSW